MKMNCNLRICFFALLFSFMAVFASQEPKPRRMEIGEKIGTIRDGNVEIVAGEKPCKLIEYAAQELQYALGKVLDAKIPVVASPSEGKISFILGENKWSDEAGLKADTSIRDSFTIRNTADRIYILGKDDQNVKRMLGRGYETMFERGTLYGVYEWLIRFAGVRYYFIGELGEIYPRQNELAFPKAEIFHYPYLPHRLGPANRGVLPGNPPGGDKIYKLWTKMGYRSRIETIRIPHCHGMQFMGYPARFCKTHPEYMALKKDGLRFNEKSERPHWCYSSGIREEIYKDMVSWFKGEPASNRGITFRGKVQWWQHVRPGFFDIMPNDSFYGCQCEECKKQWTNENDYASEFIWKFVAECARRLKQDGIDGKITMMAYRPYRRVPSVDIPDNVLVKLAEYGPWGVRNKAKDDADFEEIKAWSKKVGADRLRMWVYLCKMKSVAFPGVPSPTPDAVGQYFKRVAPYISGAYMESETDKYINNYLGQYVYNEIAWYRDVDPKELIKEHHRLMFGKAAEEMGWIFQHFEDIWLTRVVGRVVMNELGPMVSPPSDYELWNEIYTPEELQKIEKIFDLAADKVKDDEMSAKRVRLFREEWLDALKSARELYMLRNSARDDLLAYLGKPIFLGRFGKAAMHSRDVLRNAACITRENGNLKIVFDCDEPYMDMAFALKRNHDDFTMWRDSGVEIFLNPSGDRKTIYQIVTNLEGCVADMTYVRDGIKHKNINKDWESNAVVKVEKFEKSFRISVSIPEKSLGTINEECFPFNLCRDRSLKADAMPELYSWGAPLIQSYDDCINWGILSFKEDTRVNLVSNSEFTAPDKQGGRFHGNWFGAKPEQFTQDWYHKLDSTEFFAGGKSLKLVSNGEKLIDVCQYIKGMKPSTKYRISMLTKLDNVKPVKAKGGFLMQYKYGVKLIFPKIPLYGTLGWCKHTLDFTTPDTVDPKPFIQVRIINATGTVWVDCVRIEELK